MNAFVDRMIRASKLDAHLYEEVEKDEGALGQAAAVVAISSVAAGIGTIGDVGPGGLVAGTLAGLAGWFVWAFLVYLIGTKLLPEPQTSTDTRELLRTIGFSSAPGIIRALGIIPGLTSVLFLVANVWMIAAMVVAVRQALDYTGTGRAVLVCVIGWGVQLAVVLLLFAVLGGVAVPD